MRRAKSTAAGPTVLACDSTVTPANGRTSAAMRGRSSTGTARRSKKLLAEDLPRIAELCSPFDAVTVESHARLLGPPVLVFQRLLRGRLEIAMGLERVHPDALPRINKHLDLARFDMAAAFLHKHDIDVRVFVLLGAPHVPASESVEWTVRTARYAVERGAAVVSIIPVRGGNGEMERLQQAGLFIPPTRAQLNEVLAACADVDAAVVSADPWDLDKLPS